MRIAVTLLATSNTFLHPHLPLIGVLEILEMSSVGTIIRCSFRAEYLDGTLAAPVEIPHREFTYGTPDPEYPAGRLPTMPAWKATRGKGLWTPEERRANRHAQQLHDVPSRNRCPYCMTSLEEQCPWH